MSLTYGYDLKDGGDFNFMEAPMQAVELMSPIVLPGATLVNHLPFRAVSYFITPIARVSWLFSVRHIHSWVPFLNYEPLIREGRELSEKIKNAPIDFVKNAMVCCDSAPGIHFQAEKPCYSIMAQPFSHWQASFYRS